MWTYKQTFYITQKLEVIVQIRDRGLFRYFKVRVLFEKANRKRAFLIHERLCNPGKVQRRVFELTSRPILVPWNISNVLVLWNQGFCCLKSPPLSLSRISNPPPTLKTVLLPPVSKNRLNIWLNSDFFWELYIKWKLMKFITNIRTQCISPKPIVLKLLGTFFHNKHIFILFLKLPLSAVRNSMVSRPRSNQSNCWISHYGSTRENSHIINIYTKPSCSCMVKKQLNNFNPNFQTLRCVWNLFVQIIILPWHSTFYMVTMETISIYGDSTIILRMSKVELPHLHWRVLIYQTAVTICWEETIKWVKCHLVAIACSMHLTQLQSSFLLPLSRC